MEAEEILKALKHKPFVPVRMHVSDHSHYDIRHQDQVVVSRRIGRSDVSPFQDVAIISNVHITRILPLKARKKSR